MFPPNWSKPAIPSTDYYCRGSKVNSNPRTQNHTISTSKYSASARPSPSCTTCSCSGGMKWTYTDGMCWCLNTSTGSERRTTSIGKLWGEPKECPLYSHSINGMRTWCSSLTAMAHRLPSKLTSPCKILWLSTPPCTSTTSQPRAKPTVA